MARSRLRRVSGARKALLRSLVTALFQHGQIRTTESKAKELRHVADKMISLAKRGDLHARRQAEGFIMDKAVTKKLFDEIAKKYTDRNGGYTRIMKLGHRKGDNAPIVIMELVTEPGTPKATKAAPAPKKAAAPKKVEAAEEAPAEETAE